MCSMQNTNILFFLTVFIESDYSYYNLILKKAGQFLDNLHINLLKFAFSIRAYSPAIQMFQQVGKIPQLCVTEACWRCA